MKSAIDDVESFVKSYELPGVPNRWLRLNTRLGLFDPVFELAHSQTPETLVQVFRETGCAGDGNAVE